jgi:cell division septation protein DedD
VLWFRALLIVLVLGVIAAVAVPYVREVTTQPAKTPAASVTAAVPAPAAVPPPAPVPARAAPTPVVTATPSPAAATLAAAIPASPPPKPAAARTAKASEASAETAKDAPKEAPKGMGAGAASKPAVAKPSSPAAVPEPYWVQVGAFKDPDTAKRLAAQLRGQGFRVEQSITTTGGGPPAAPPPAAPPESPGDRYNVLVSNASAADVDAKLAAKGMTSESTAGGVVVQPSLSLREAINLSRDLTEAGLTVQVRRAGEPAPRAEGARSGGTLHRVRVGGFADRAAAVAALKALQAKGFTPFIARGKP